MSRLHFSVIAKTDGVFTDVNGQVVNTRLHRVKSRKGGDDEKLFMKKWLEVIDVLTLPLGFVEANLELLLREYYSTNGKSGWSEQEVFNFLLHLKRNPKFIGEFIQDIKTRHGAKTK